MGVVRRQGSSMSTRTIVQRLITFLKRPDALEHHRREPVHRPYIDYEPREVPTQRDEAPPPGPGESRARHEHVPLVAGEGHVPGRGSRLDALVMRVLDQFHARFGFVVRYDERGRMRYITGRDRSGRFVAHTEIDPDRRALLLALQSGESQLFVRNRGERLGPVLCGPLRINGQVIGALYLDDPLRSRLHRAVFDVYCAQVARMLADGMT